MKGMPKTNEEGHSQTETANLCSFYKLIVDPTIHFHKLELPEEFISEFGDEVLGSCNLTVPTGETFQVALVEKGDVILVQDGWSQFVDRFSIVYGYFILFTYLGDSNFNVNLFDSSACEVSYPCYVGTSSAMQCEDDETTEDTRKETEDSEFEADSAVWLRGFDEEFKLLAAAGISLPVKPFFVATLKPYCFDGGFLNLPRAFGREHITWNAGDFAVVKMCGGKQWPIRCCISCLNWAFGKGWSNFAEQNHLKVGDVCVFELTDAENQVFEAHVARSFKVNR